MRFIGLLCADKAQRLIATVALRAKRVPRYRVFVRGFGDEPYTPVADQDDDFSYHDAVVAADAPFLFFNRLVCDDATSGMNWAATLRCNLKDLATEVIADPQSLPLPPGATRTWISSLLGAGADGQTLACVRATSRPTKDGGETVAYEVCRFDVAARAVTPLTGLATPFY